MEPNDAHTAAPNNMNQTPQSLALSEEHDRAVGPPLERRNFDRATADPGSPTSLPLTIPHRDECAMEMQFRSHGPNIADFNGQPTPLPAAPNAPPRLLDLQDSVPNYPVGISLFSSDS